MKKLRISSDLARIRGLVACDGDGDGADGELAAESNRRLVGFLSVEVEEGKEAAGPLPALSCGISICGMFRVASGVACWDQSADLVNQQLRTAQ